MDIFFFFFSQNLFFSLTSSLSIGPFFFFICSSIYGALTLHLTVTVPPPTALLRCPLYWFHKFIYCKPIQPYRQLTPPSPYIITFSFLWWDYLRSPLAAFYVVVIQLPSRVWLLGTPWTATHQAPLSSTISQNLLKFMPIESVMPSTISSFAALFSSCLQSFPAPGSFPMSLLFTSGGQSIGDSATVLSVNIQG